VKEGLVETKYAFFWFDNGILFACYRPNIVIDINVAKQIVAERLNFSNGKDWPLLADIRQLLHVDFVARKYLAGSVDATKNISAGAILGDSLISRFAGNIFLKIDKPKIPSKFFTDEKKAISWLEKFKQ